MRTQNKTMTVFAGIAAVAAVAVATGPANAAHKGDASPSRVAAHKTITGAANSASHAARPSAGTGQRVTGDACSLYGDGHGDLCLWYLSGFTGSRTGFLRDDSNLVDDVFRSAGAGQGSSTTNNAESDWNYDRFNTVFVATSPGFTGSVGFIGPNSGGNFSSTYKNNVESLYWAN